MLVFCPYVLVRTRVLLVCCSYVLVCTRMLLVCTCMYLYVTRMYSYVLVWCFSHDPHKTTSYAYETYKFDS